MKDLLIESIDLNDYQLNSSHLSLLDERTVVVKRWNWDYDLAWNFQKKAVSILQNIPQLRILICCNHPRVLTNGRGLQKPRKGESFDLVEFKKEDYPQLPYPFYQIERGGGLTFHHPGQFIFYPIVKLNPKTLSLSKMIDDIFDSSIAVLTAWGIENLSHENKLLGLWHFDRKLASMGIAIEKLTTFHGMALNLIRDDQMMKTLRTLNPCGMTADTYCAAEDIHPLPESTIDRFTDDFLYEIEKFWSSRSSDKDQ